MPRTRPPYLEEFRREAIRLAQPGDKPQRRLAQDMDISDGTLRNWLKEEEAAKGERLYRTAVSVLALPLRGFRACSELTPQR